MIFGWRALQWANSFQNYQNNPTGNNLGNNLFCLEKKVIADIVSESKPKERKYTLQGCLH